MKESWNPPKYQCKDCKKVIFSTYPGEFVACNCKGDSYIFVDQTRYYARYGGDPSKFIELKDESDVT